MLDRKESSILLVRNGESVTIKIPKQHLKDLDIYLENEGVFLTLRRLYFLPGFWLLSLLLL